MPAARPVRRRRFGAGAAIGLAVLLLAVVAAGVAGYVFLPSATVAITPHPATIGPLRFDVLADPDATEVDPVAGVIPAQRLDMPVEARGDFPATGKRVEKAKASGTVRFDSINTIGPVAIPAGTRVSTLGAIVFATTRGVTVPRAQVSGTTIEHGVVDVGVRAVKDGPEGNVGAGEITQVPDSLSTLQVSVSNRAPTSGGKLDEFPRVVQEDVDAALAQLRTDLETQFAAQLAAPAGVAGDATLISETALLGEPQTTVDPTTLVGQEVEQFTLEAFATGSALAVDPAPLGAIVRGRLEAAVTEGHRLVDDSIDIATGAATVSGGSVRFPVSGVALELPALDADALAASIRGKSRSEALAILEPLGTVELALWPDWVTAVPTLDQRVEVVIRAAAETPRPSAPPLPTATVAPSVSAAPSASPSDSPGDEPVPSG